jgi:hypothetical protein
MTENTEEFDRSALQEIENQITKIANEKELMRQEVDVLKKSFLIDLEQAKKIGISAPLAFWDMPNTMHGLDRSLIFDGIISNFSQAVHGSKNIIELNRVLKKTQNYQDSFFEALFRILSAISNIGQVPEFKTWIQNNHEWIKPISKKENIPIYENQIYHRLFLKQTSFLWSNHIKIKFENRQFLDHPVDWGLNQIPGQEFSNFVIQRGLDAQFECIIEGKFKNGNEMDIDNRLISNVWTQISQRLCADPPTLPSYILLGVNDIDFFNLIDDLTNLGIPVVLITQKYNANRIFIDWDKPNLIKYHVIIDFPRKHDYKILKANYDFLGNSKIQLLLRSGVARINRN